jgi:hypothetical protein
MKCNLVDVSAKGPSAVMVLAVYIICDCPAHSYETCSWCDGEKPPFGKKHVDKIAKSDATLAADQTRGFVEIQNPVEATTLDQTAACVEARIPITPASAKGKQPTRLSRIEDLGNLVIPSWFVYLTMLGPWIAAPGKNMLGVKRGLGALAFRQARG